ncbi:ATP-binding protein [Lyngbya sp. PCC 8106]|uniref:sensor histidine kinase n=1 Tax=Lyngbya sp. (strain PCC 8106) TaxID=313612 RepID=UPI0000EACBEF|nr:ATP-binding protein [Lyngbya sp. PCC 8106]EAW37930.1 two-component sensor histidine kinase [Lyngbya sp. PCC 8106]
MMSKMGLSPSSQNLASLSKKIPATQWLSRLKVRHKIAIGYAIILSITVSGISLGIKMGDHYHHKALKLQEDSSEENQLIHRLQTHLTLAIIHQNKLIYLLENLDEFQQEYMALKKHERILKETWKALKLSYETSEVNETSEELNTLASISQGYNSTILNYFNELDQQVKQLNLNELNSENLEIAKQLLLDFRKSKSVDNIEEFINELEGMVELVEQEAIQAENAMKTSEKLRIQTITLSIIISVLIAILLAIYTSQAITYPIQILTQTANRIQEENDFDLQVSQITEDEIGDLTQAFNHLILQVKQLLESQNQATKNQLLQQEKMSTLGRLLAEVAHEINNPINFISGNLTHAIEYTDHLFDLLQTYEAEIDHPPDKILIKAEEIEREFIQEDFPKLLQSMKIGVERTKEIVLSLKNFSRLEDQEQAKLLNLSECLDSSLLILNHRIKKGIIVTKHYQTIPLIEGYTSSLSQVFINIIGNAIDALSEVSQPTKEIKITTEPLNSEQVAVHIQDNGPGISVENQQKIFESFFTTKPADMGTGLGLSISQDIIENKHGGQIKCQSSLGVGTKFMIILPIKYLHLETPSPIENNQNFSNRDQRQIVEYTDIVN